MVKILGANFFRSVDGILDLDGKNIFVFDSVAKCL